MTLRLDDTIAALASAAGPAPRGIVRISGPATYLTLQARFTPQGTETWPLPSHASRFAGTLQIASLPTPLPMDLLLWPDHRSYTGQQTAELHTIGSPPLLEAVLTELYAQGIRPARPGEFTLRAFLAGRVDLVQAEAVLGVIDAADHVELQTALSQLAGGVSTRLAETRGQLLDLLADLEAGLDFVEEDIEFVSSSDVIARLSLAGGAIRELLESADARMQTTGRRRVVLAGLPNAGKSTLFNALLDQNTALVSEVAGTTRDYLSAPFAIDDLALELIDTAGWEEEQEGIGLLAQQLRSERFREADLVLWCRPCGLSDVARQQDTTLQESLAELGIPVIHVETKADLAKSADQSAAVSVSAQSKLGLDALKQAISARLTLSSQGERQLLGTTAARCRESLSSASASLENAISCAAAGVGDELTAVEIRDALQHLGAILGSVYTDDILDRIFSRFCIGK